MKMHAVSGIHPVLAVLRAGPERIREIYVQDDLGRSRAARLAPLLESDIARVQRVDAATLEKLAGTDRHQGVVVVASPPGVLDETAARAFVAGVENPLLLVLDGLEDPHNVGACLRTADAAGVDLVVSGQSRGVGLTPTVRKVSAGAADVVPFARVANLARFLDHIRQAGLWVYGADERAEVHAHDTDLSGPVALVVGAEGKGLRRLTRDKCDGLVSLPMLGSVGSLNVSVAAGVLVYEAVRQRISAGG